MPSPLPVISANTLSRSGIPDLFQLLQLHAIFSASLLLAFRAIPCHLAAEPIYRCCPIGIPGSRSELAPLHPVIKIRGICFYSVCKFRIGRFALIERFDDLNAVYVLTFIAEDIRQDLFRECIQYGSQIGEGFIIWKVCDVRQQNHPRTVAFKSCRSRLSVTQLVFRALAILR